MKSSIRIFLLMSLFLFFAGCGGEKKTKQEPSRQAPKVASVMCNMDSLLAVGTRLVMSLEDTNLFFGIADCVTSTPTTPFQEVMLDLGMGDYDKAEKSLSEILDKPGIIPAEKARVYFFKGIASYLKADTSGALEAFDSSLEDYPTAPEVLTSRGIIKSELGRFSGAIKDYDSAIAVRHDFSEAWYHRGNAYYMLGQFKPTFFNYDSALIYRPNMMKARYNKAAMLHRLGRLDEAMANFDSILTMKHNDYMAWIGKGLIYNRWEKNEMALDCFDSSLHYKRDNPEAWNNKAATLGVMKMYEQAQACIDSSLHYEPDNVSTKQLQDLIKKEQELPSEK